jgi:type VI secretion system protein ImpC
MMPPDNLSTLYASCDCTLTPQALDLSEFIHEIELAKKPIHERLSAGLQVLSIALDMENTSPSTDIGILDVLLLRLDQRISALIDDVRQQTDFLNLESLWKSLAFLLQRAPDNRWVQIEILNVDKAELHADFAEHLSLKETALYHHVYDSEYDTPGGEPFAALITPYEFSPTTDDINCLDRLSQLAALAHCPLIANIGPAFFFKKTLAEVSVIKDVANYFRKSEYIQWHAFRQQETTRFIGLCFPRFLLPGQSDQQNTVFHYHENPQTPHLCWGHASFALATTLCDSFHRYGWCVNIRGPNTGGKVAQLPVAKQSLEDGVYYRYPIEYLISESTELTLAQAGIIPLTYYKNSDFACFFSANSIHLAKRYDDPKVTANHRINARLPYIFLISRIAHYLKVLQRERIGAQKSASALAMELNAWLKTLVTKMNHPSAELLSTHPLSEGFVEVEAIEDSPGYYRVQLYAKPHFQVEGIDITLNLTAQLPGNTQT